MDGKEAESLVGTLEDHIRDSSQNLFPVPELSPETKKELISILVRTKVSESSRFYEPIKDQGRFLDAAETYRLTFRRVLRNGKARDYQLSWWKKVWENVASHPIPNYFFRIYDSDIVTRRLRVDKEVVRMMTESAENGHPHSLLCKLKIYDDNYGGPKIQTSELLLIPGVEKLPAYGKKIDIAA